MRSRHDIQLHQLIHDISFHPKDRLERFLALSIQQRALVLTHLTSLIEHDIISSLPTPDLLSTLEQLDPDEITDIIQLLRPRQQKLLVAQ